MEEKLKFVKPGHFLHGLLNSDFYNFLIYRYSELQAVFAKLIDENNKSHPETTSNIIELWISQFFEAEIAENNRMLRDLEIYIENEETKKGSITLNQMKKNNLILINEKSECFIKYLRALKFNPSYVKKDKPYKSLRRVYSFILAESYHKGNTVIKSMSKPDFKNYVSEKFKDPKKSNTVYQTVRSSYKHESNFLNFYTEMKKDHFKDYDYAMKIYRNYFPENLESESK